MLRASESVGSYAKVYRVDMDMDVQRKKKARGDSTYQSPPESAREELALVPAAAEAKDAGAIATGGEGSVELAARWQRGRKTNDERAASVWQAGATTGEAAGCRWEEGGIIVHVRVSYRGWSCCVESHKEEALS